MQISVIKKAFVMPHWPPLKMGETGLKQEPTSQESGPEKETYILRWMSNEAQTLRNTDCPSGVVVLEAPKTMGATGLEISEL